MRSTPKTRPYKDFLTPTLHRRFVAALSVCLGLCYLESIIIGGKKSLFWIWFPLGITGIRTGLLFIPVLCLFLLRIAQVHFGYRTTFSGWNTVTTYAFKPRTVQTVATYSLSAFMFGEIYIWSMPTEADLSRIKVIPRTNRTILNEKPIYFKSFFFFLAIIQAGVHIFYDYDRINNPVIKVKSTALSKKRKNKRVSTLQQLSRQISALILSSIKRSVLAAVVSPIIYAIDFRVYPYSVRSVAWCLNRSWAKIFWTLPKSNSLPSTWPFHWRVLITTATSGTLLVILWEVGNAAFSVYTVQEPLKNNQPITNKSRDPNGSLLNGLKSKKLQTKVFAFWELFIISHHFKDRRKSIFHDIDRTGGSCWSQVRDVCLDEINSISNRIDDYENPQESVTSAPENIPSLPRLSGPLRDGLNAPGDLFLSPASPSTPVRDVAKAVGNFAKSRGQSPSTGLSPNNKLLAHVAENVVLTEKQKEAIANSGFGERVKDWAMWFLQTDLGRPFRQEYRRTLAAVTLGTPYGDMGVIIDAVYSLSRLTVSSLTEDKYGNVQRDVKMIIQTFTATIMKLEAFRSTTEFHWTDVLAIDESPEADKLLATLRRGLSKILDAFEKYSGELKLTQSELSMAREAVGKQVLEQALEMQQAT